MLRATQVTRWLDSARAIAPMSAISGPFLLAIDAGTESVRVGVFDVAGTFMAHAAAPYDTHYPRTGWAEQDPQAWWTALHEALRSALMHLEARCGRSAIRHVVGIGLDATTCTLVTLDGQDRPVRPALLWMDVRASQQAQRIFETGHPALCYSPSGLAAEWMLPKALWLSEHEAETYARTTRLVEYTDWLAYKLCGRWALNLNTVTQRWHYNARGWDQAGQQGQILHWPTSLFEAVGLADLAAKFPTDVVPPGERLGGLLPEVAQAVGAPELTGVPVFEGGGDAFVGLLGLNVTCPGQIGLITGSSNVIGAFSRDGFHVPGLFGGFPDAIVPGLWLVEAGQASTGSVLAWFKRTFALDLPSDAAYQQLDEQASQLEMGAGGVIALDHFQGNRTPYTDSRSRGAVWGLTLASTRGHVYRALLEGIAYGTRQILEVLQQAATTAAGDVHAGVTAPPAQQLDAIVACGGATRSPIFMQLYADICGLPISVMRVPDASLVGGAILAAVGAGLYHDLPTAASAMTHVARTYQPDMSQHARAGFYFEQYKQTYANLRDLMHRAPPSISP